MNWNARYAIKKEISKLSPTENLFSIKSINITQSNFAKGFTGSGGSIYSRLNDGTGRWHRLINKGAFGDDTRSYPSRGVTHQYTIFVDPEISYGITTESVFSGKSPVKIYKKDGDDFSFSLGSTKFDEQKQPKRYYLNKEHVSVEPKVGWVPVQFGEARWSNGDVHENSWHVGSPVKEIH